MTEPFDGTPHDPMAELQREYLREAPERLADLRKGLASFRRGEPDARESLRARFHRLAGSGGSFGLPMVTAVARAMEERLQGDSPITPRDADQIERAILDLKDAFDEAALDLKVPMMPGRIPGFGWRTLLLMPPGVLREQLATALQETGFQVDMRDTEVDPHEVSPSERPDLVVIGSDLTPDPLVAARSWAATLPERPRAVVLADAAGRCDRLQTAAAGVDASFGPAALPRGLAQYARALAQIGSPPASVVVVEDDPVQARLFATWLGQINARTSICTTATQAREALARETPDLVLIDVDLPDVDGYALARLMRQDPRLALVPIVFLTARRSLADKMEGLRAGGDDFLAKPVERSHLLQVVLTRTERGRRIRELVHRDGLTGLLNHATLVEELEHAVAFAARYGEPMCFLMLDLDHFKRVNDIHGHLIGDQVLVHVARVFQRLIRGSDLLGRYGGEEFGIILRRCPPTSGLAIAEKLREGLATSPVTLPDGQQIPLRVSIGVATFPGSGMTATAVTAAADRALYQAKSAGRNRVEVG